MKSTFRQAALGTLLLGLLGCATAGQPGFSIEANTGSKTGNPFEIRLTASGSDLKAVLVNRSSSPQMLLQDAQLQTTTLELLSATGSAHQPYDSRMIKKQDMTPYCNLFITLPPGKKLLLGWVRFKQKRDGFTGEWGPFNFDELPASKYQARVTWLSERAQCLDETTRQMRKLPRVWRGVVHSNQVTLNLH